MLLAATRAVTKGGISIDEAIDQAAQRFSLNLTVDQKTRLRREVGEFVADPPPKEDAAKIKDHLEFGNHIKTEKEVMLRSMYLGAYHPEDILQMKQFVAFGLIMEGKDFDEAVQDAGLRTNDGTLDEALHGGETPLQGIKDFKEHLARLAAQQQS